MRPNAGFYNLFMKSGGTQGSKEGIRDNLFFSLFLCLGQPSHMGDEGILIPVD